jgi:hypothetical protein
MIIHLFKSKGFPIIHQLGFLRIIIFFIHFNIVSYFNYIFIGYEILKYIVAKAWLRTSN